MSVHTWGEAPHGTWQLEIHNEGRLLGEIDIALSTCLRGIGSYPIGCCVGDSAGGGREMVVVVL